jgi:UDP-glucose 4-epimerase
VINTAKIVTSKNINIINSERRHGDPDTLVADSIYAKQELFWHPKRGGLDEIINDAWKWELKSFGSDSK